MSDPRTAEDLLALVARLSPRERDRFLRLLINSANDAQMYQASRAKQDEFKTHEDSLAWDADGWDNVG